MPGLDFESKPTFREWDDAIHVLTRQLRLAARILERKGLVERGEQLRHQAKLLDDVFAEAHASFTALTKAQRTTANIEGIENRAVGKLMRHLPALIESMPLLAKQVAAASGSVPSEGIFKGIATEFFLGPPGQPHEGVGNGASRV